MISESIKIKLLVLYILSIAVTVSVSPPSLLCTGSIWNFCIVHTVVYVYTCHYLHWYWVRLGILVFSPYFYFCQNIWLGNRLTNQGASINQSNRVVETKGHVILPHPFLHGMPGNGNWKNPTATARNFFHLNIK